MLRTTRAVAVLGRGRIQVFSVRCCRSLSAWSASLTQATFERTFVDAGYLASRGLKKNEASIVVRHICSHVSIVRYGNDTCSEHSETSAPPCQLTCPCLENRPRTFVGAPGTTCRHTVPVQLAPWPARCPWRRVKADVRGRPTLVAPVCWHPWRSCYLPRTGRREGSWQTRGRGSGRLLTFWSSATWRRLLKTRPLQDYCCSVCLGPS